MNGLRRPQPHEVLRGVAGDEGILILVVIQVRAFE
jgi:hypothetical protein